MSKPSEKPPSENASSEAQTPSDPPRKDKARQSDLDFAADTKAAFLESRAPYASLLLFLLVGIVSALFFWAHSSKVDEITRGQGKVIPSRNLQVVQNLEGGILAELFVKEGQIVEAGQILLRLDDTAFAASHQESLSKSDNLQATIARLETEASDRETIQFPEYILQNRSDLVESETSLFAVRRANHQAKTRNLEKSLELKRRELSITEPLATDGVVSQVELLRLQSAINDTEGQLIRIRSDYSREVMTQLNEAKAELEQVQQSINAYHDRVLRAEIKSPAYGTINRIHSKTIGGVIRPGDPILEIVPLESDLLVEANILPSDIGFIHPGQEAIVKLTAYDFSIYGGLKGTVERISADTFTNERGESFYKIRVRTGERSLATGDQELRIIPGMQVQVDILTGKKSVLDYAIKPLMRARMNALTER